MGTKNFFCSPKKCSLTALVVLVASFQLLGCQSRPVQEDIVLIPGRTDTTPVPPPGIAKPPAETPLPRPTDVTLPQPSVPPPVQMEAPRPQEILQSNQPNIGLILGPGAIRAFAHIGLLQEFAKAKLPVRAVVGYEMSALVAALYASKGQAYDVEWQMMKIKQDQLINKSLIGGRIQPSNLTEFSKFLTEVFGKSRSDDSKLPFACPAFNMSKQNIFLMSKGVWSQLLPYCLAGPPLFQSYQQNVASNLELKSAVDFLKARGINFIIYVNLLQSRGDAYLDGFANNDNIYWTYSSYLLSRPAPGVDMVVQIPLFEYGLVDFAKRREIMQRGAQIGQSAAQNIVRRLGL